MTDISKHLDATDLEIDVLLSTITSTLTSAPLLEEHPLVSTVVDFMDNDDDDEEQTQNRVRDHRSLTQQNALFVKLQDELFALAESRGTVDENTQCVNRGSVTKASMITQGKERAAALALEALTASS